MRTLIATAVAVSTLALGTSLLSSTSAEAAGGCGFFKNFSCGVEGPKHSISKKEFKRLPTRDQELYTRKVVRQVAAKDCVFVEFKANGAPVPSPRVFAPEGTAFGCPQQESWYCIVCTAFLNGHAGMQPVGPVARWPKTNGVRGTSQYLPRRSTGMWMPKWYVGKLAWCPDDTGDNATYAFKGEVRYGS